MGWSICNFYESVHSEWVCGFILQRHASTNLKYQFSLFRIQQVLCFLSSKRSSCPVMLQMQFCQLLFGILSVNVSKHLGLEMSWNVFLRFFPLKVALANRKSGPTRLQRHWLIAHGSEDLALNCYQHTVPCNLCLEFWLLNGNRENLELNFLGFWFEIGFPQPHQLLAISSATRATLTWLVLAQHGSAWLSMTRHRTSSSWSRSRWEAQLKAKPLLLTAWSTSSSS